MHVLKYINFHKSSFMVLIISSDVTFIFKCKLLLEHIVEDFWHMFNYRWCRVLAEFWCGVLTSSVGVEFWNSFWRGLGEIRV